MKYMPMIINTTATKWTELQITTWQFLIFFFLFVRGCQSGSSCSAFWLTTGFHSDNWLEQWVLCEGSVSFPRTLACDGYGDRSSNLPLGGQMTQKPLCLGSYQNSTQSIQYCKLLQYCMLWVLWALPFLGGRDKIILHLWKLRQQREIWWTDTAEDLPHRT